MQRIEIPEALSFLFEPARYKVAYGGRGSAKSWSFARALLIIGASRPLRVLCCREIQRSIEESVHQLLTDQVAALGLQSFYTIQSNHIFAANGTSFAFAGLRALNVAQLKSFEGIDVCWVEEAQNVSAQSWRVLIPTIRKEQSEIWVSFNPELDTDETYNRFVLKPPPATIVRKINWRDNPWFPKVLEAERAHLERTDPESYRNVWEGEPLSSLPGAIYRLEMVKLQEEGRVRPVPYDPNLKVHTIWDLGWNDLTSVLMVQRLHSEVRVIDFLEDSHRTLDQYVAELKDRRYNWGSHWLPHDGVHRDLKSGQSAQDVLKRLGWQSDIVPAHDVEQGIKNARQVFGRCYFDEAKASGLVEHLRRYRRQINQVTNEPQAPLHDAHSHAADAFRYMAAIVDKLKNDTGWSKIQYPKTGIV